MLKLIKLLICIALMLGVWGSSVSAPFPFPMPDHPILDLIARKETVHISEPFKDDAIGGNGEWGRYQIRPQTISHLMGWSGSNQDIIKTLSNPYSSRILAWTLVWMCERKLIKTGERLTFYNTAYCYTAGLNSEIDSVPRKREYAKQVALWGAEQQLRSKMAQARERGL